MTKMSSIICNLSSYKQTLVSQRPHFQTTRVLSTAALGGAPSRLVGRALGDRTPWAGRLQPATPLPGAYVRPRLSLPSGRRERPLELVLADLHGVPPPRRPVEPFGLQELTDRGLGPALRVERHQVPLAVEH